MKEYWKHFKTICKHKYYVFKECKACGITLQGITHDLSKFSRAEFVSSAKHFQGDRSPIDAEKEETGYSLAWNHHKGHNPHHWEYWIDFDRNGNIIAQEIPYKYVVEMLCDWIGAGIVYSGKEWAQEEPLKYFDKVRGGRHFHKETEALIVELLIILAEKGIEEFHNKARLK